ncbi:hypothetical protein SAMN02927921_04160 [Sinomicrobium oceani]|uniref:Lipoprotein n=1 Tax=Sinomicrobium oceani TaxID=1150368 RepID=A0A1K1RY86_9FLAO|nr:hypothetical protein [Sinomicrobium oceani]SFW76797.1 hypothetical protein SAMN02927921_04160 [Sinomicrobium oceani]
MRRIFLTLVICTVISCRGDKKSEQKTDSEVPEEELHVSLPEVMRFTGERAEEVGQWKAYVALDSIMKAFREEEGGDVVLQLDDLLEKQKALESSDFPPKFDNPSVRSRLAVVKTYLMQTRLEAPDPVPEAYLVKQKVKILRAFNDFERQLEVMMKGSVTEQFLNEMSNEPIARKDSLRLDSLRQGSDSTGTKKP